MADIQMSRPFTSATVDRNKTLTPTPLDQLSSATVMPDSESYNPLAINEIDTIKKSHNFDVSKVVATSMMREFPISFFADLNSKECNGASLHLFGTQDDENATMFHEFSLDKLRIASSGVTGTGNPFAIDHVDKRGGELIYRKPHASALAQFAKALGDVATSTIPTNPVLTDENPEQALVSMDIDGKTYPKVLPIAWRVGTGEEAYSAGGTKAEATITKLRALLDQAHYTQVGLSDNMTEVSTTNNWYGMMHGTNANSIHGMFNDFCFFMDDSEYQENEVNVRVLGMLFRDDLSQFVMFYDFNYNNLEDKPSTGDTVLLEEIKKRSTVFEGGFTRQNPRMLVGMYTNVPDPIEQAFDGAGEKLNGLMYDIDYKVNPCRIIRSDQFTISGSQKASQNKLVLNQPEKIRMKMLKDFKTKRRNVQLYSQGASSKLSSNGNPVNTNAGIFDYSMFPIRYTRLEFDRYSGGDKIKAVETFIEAYAKGVFSYTQETEKTVFCSKYMMRMLSDVIRYGVQEPNATGMSYANNPNAPQGTLDIRSMYKTIQTSEGTIHFVVEEGLDYVTESHLPYFMENANPKHLLIAMDTSKISSCIQRAPFMRIGIQGNAADYTAEDMVSEETVELLDPMKHNITEVLFR